MSTRTAHELSNEEMARNFVANHRYILECALYNRTLPKIPKTIIVQCFDTGERLQVIPLADSHITATSDITPRASYISDDVRLGYTFIPYPKAVLYSPIGTRRKNIRVFPDIGMCHFDVDSSNAGVIIPHKDHYPVLNLHVPGAIDPSDTFVATTTWSIVIPIDKDGFAPYVITTTNKTWLKYLDSSYPTRMHQPEWTRWCPSFHYNQEQDYART